jgi:signal peptidase II
MSKTIIDSTPSPARIARSRWIGAIVALAIVAADQLIKLFVTGPLALQARIGDPIEIVSFFRLQYAENDGVSLGMLQADSEAMRWGLVALTAAISLGVVIWIFKEKLRGDIIALAIILGGAIGNIIDRVRLGYVVDYADFHVGNFSPFMIFNLADAAITIGVLLLVARALLHDRAKSKTIDPSHPPAASTGQGE